MFTDDDYMKIALEEAQKAAEKDEVPVGAVVVQGNVLLATASRKTSRTIS